MPKDASNGRTPLLNDQDTVYCETIFDQQLTYTQSPSTKHTTPDALTAVPSTIRPTGSSPNKTKWRKRFLKVVLFVIVVVSLTWITTRLYMSYKDSWHITVAEDHYHETVLIEGVLDASRKHTLNYSLCNIANKDARFDCFPGPGASQETCEARGCCWKAVVNAKLQPNGTVGRDTDVPFCYFPTNYPSYEALHISPQPYGYRVNLQSIRNRTTWPANINNLHLDIYIETKTRLHFKITDATKYRFEVPIETPTVTHKVKHPEYVFLVKSKPFAIVVKRKSTNTIIFDSSIAPLLYGDQFLQISTVLPSGFVYGLGEQYSAFAHNTTMWHQMSLWARDQPPVLNQNLYGVHPFFMSLDKGKNAYGVFLLNSNAMDIDLQPYPALTYRTIGGVLDFYVFIGPTPSDVIQQYTAVIGRPTMPPYWGLGFHLCRWGYQNTTGLRTVINRMRNASFPYDSQWVDIDYMDRHLDWTYDQQRFAGLPDLINDIHEHGQHFVIIVDPAISSTNVGKYAPYDSGIKQGVFVKDANGSIIQGKVWPGQTVFPDFSNPQTETWWYEMAKAFHDKIKFDGLWTDMNEPSNFVTGSTSGCTQNNLDNPPYTPGIQGGNLADKTLCPSAQHYLGTHYNLHSLYGHLESKVSHSVLEKLRGKRSFVITRSTFPGTGRYAGHWTGDNRATWDDLYYSIPVMLNFQMYGIPLVGADVCGFSGTTNEELCTRWMQLASFYPFMRNHNMLHAMDQDPASFSTMAQTRMRSSLILRYALLPFLYTLFYQSHVHGNAVINALCFIYPHDANTYNLDRQFLWGDALLISPVLTKGESTLKAYLPQDTWYILKTGARVSKTGQFVTLDAPLDTINVHVRGGSIIPRQHPLNETTTSKARRNPFDFLVALDLTGQAHGSLYLDDGETIDAAEKGQYNLLNLTVTMGKLTSSITHMGYKPVSDILLDKVTILGVINRPVRVTSNSTGVNFTWDSRLKLLVVNGLTVDLTHTWTMQWSSSTPSSYTDALRYYFALAV